MYHPKLPSKGWIFSFQKDCCFVKRIKKSNLKLNGFNKCLNWGERVSRIYMKNAQTDEQTKIDEFPEWWIPKIVWIAHQRCVLLGSSLWFDFSFDHKIYLLPKNVYLYKECTSRQTNKDVSCWAAPDGLGSPSLGNLNVVQFLYLLDLFWIFLIQ